MTHDEFEMLVTGVGTSQSAYDRLTQIGDELVRRRIVSEEAFWHSVEPAEQTLFAICGMINVGGSGGFESFCRQFSGSALALLTCAERALREIAEERYAGTLRAFLELCQEHLLSEQIAIPGSFSTSQRNAFIRAERALHRTSFFRTVRPRLLELDDNMSSCWDSALPDSVLGWVKKNRETFSRALCS